MPKGTFKQYCCRSKSSENLGGNNLQTWLCCFKALCLNLYGWNGERWDGRTTPSLFPTTQLRTGGNTSPLLGSGFALFLELPCLSWATAFLIMRSTDRALETGSQRLCVSKENLKIRPTTYFYWLGLSFIIMGSYLKGTSLFNQGLETKWNVSLIQSLFGKHFSTLTLENT